MQENFFMLEGSIFLTSALPLRAPLTRFNVPRSPPDRLAKQLRVHARPLAANKVDAEGYDAADCVLSARPVQDCHYCARNSNMPSRLVQP